MREQILNLKESELTNEKVNALIDFTIHTNDLLHDINNETTKALGSVLESLKNITERLNQIDKSNDYYNKYIEANTGNISLISENIDLIIERLDI